MMFLQVKWSSSKCRVRNLERKGKSVSERRRVETQAPKGNWILPESEHIISAPRSSNAVLSSASSKLFRCQGFTSTGSLEALHPRKRLPTKRDKRRAKSKFISCQQKLSCQPKYPIQHLLCMPPKIGKCDSIKLLWEWVELYSPGKPDYRWLYPSG